MRQGEDFRLKYRPRKLSDFIGNQGLIEMARTIIQSKKRPKGIIIHGPSGTGKTSIAEVLVKGLFCENFNGDLCGNCQSCKSLRDEFNGDGLQFTAHDCTELDRTGLRTIIRELDFSFSASYGNVHIFDEFDQTRDNLQGMLHRVLELKKDIFFVFCLIDLKAIKGAFRDRCMTLKTVRPEVDDLTPWLQRICDSEGITVKNGDALKQLALSADRVPRRCIAILEKICVSGKPLTTQMVREIIQDNDEE